MYTQNTPVHVKLWHHDFWRLALANLLMTMSVYMFIPVLPQWLSAYGAILPGYAMVAYLVGIYTLGGFCSYLIQRFRRSHVCITAVLVMAICTALMFYFPSILCNSTEMIPGMLILSRFLVGAAFGLAQMILTSTLVIDTCESFQRTEANHSAAWFGRFALSLGPILALCVMRFYSFQWVVAASLVCAVISCVLLFMVDFPFKAPDDEVPTYSLDRFFLPHGFPLFVNLLLCMIAVGIILSIEAEMLFYAMMMGGFLMALLTQKYVFSNAELKSEIVTGLILIGAAMLMLMTKKPIASNYIVPVFIGLGTGIIGTRFLLFFIKLSKHCQRGTSQSSYFLSWETGLWSGILIGICLHESGKGMLPETSLAITLVALLMYQFFTHSWYLKNKNR